MPYPLIDEFPNSLEELRTLLIKQPEVIRDGLGVFYEVGFKNPYTDTVYKVHLLFYTRQSSQMEVWQVHEYHPLGGYILLSGYSGSEEAQTAYKKWMKLCLMP
jgi:hypothetical protein